MARLAASHNWMFRQAAAAYLKPPSHSSGFSPIGPNHRSASFLYSTQFMYSGKSIEDSELWVLQVFQWVPHFTSFWPTPSKLCFFFSEQFLSPCIHSADNSPVSDTSLHGESPGSSDGFMRSWKRTEDGNVYVQCITAVYTLARDPYPRVASLGRQVLRIAGVEAHSVKASRAGSSGLLLPTHQTNMSIPCLPPTSLIPGVIHRSASCLASASGWQSSPPFI